MSIKSIIYKAAIKFLRVFWSLSGGRRITAFGHNLRVTPQTVFPSYRKLKLPKGGCQSEIVRYADYVQMHAICNFVSGLPNQPVIIDVGAHHGAYAIVIGQIVRHLNGKVIAVEPNPESYKILCNNVQLNGLEDVVICEQVAVSDRPGSMNILLDDSQSQVTSQKTNFSVPVEAVTMKWLLDKHKICSVDLLIIDVEGAELLVLKGFPWQSVSVEKIFCELHPYAWKDFGCSGKDMSDFLNMYDYRCIDMYLKEYIEFENAAYIGPTLLFKKSFV